jgi:hypothetical protein
VTEVGGRQGTTTEAARASEIGQIIQLQLKVPAGDASGGVQVDFVREAGAMDGLTIDRGLDLYGRTGCLAEVNGGMFGDGFTPRVTMRMLLSLQDEARTGYVELSDMRSGTPTHALLALKCDWQR